MEEEMDTDVFKTMEEQVYWKHFSSMHFYQILPKDFINGLVLPGKFSTHISARLPNYVSLIGPSGVLCNVELLKNGDVVFFGDGWREFVKTYELKENHLLLFKYTQNLSFEVLIFDSETHCEKEATYFAKKSKYSVSRTEIERKGNTKESSSTEVLEDVGEDIHNDPDFENSNNSKNNVADELICHERVTESETPNKCISAIDTQGINRTSESNAQSEKSGQNNEKKSNAAVDCIMEVFNNFCDYNEKKNETQKANEVTSAITVHQQSREGKSMAVCEMSGQNYSKKRNAADGFGREVLEDSENNNDPEFQISKKSRHDTVEGFVSSENKDGPKAPKKSPSVLSAQEEKSEQNVPKLGEAFHNHNSDNKGREQDNGGGVIEVVPSKSSKGLVHGSHNPGWDHNNGGGVISKGPSKSSVKLIHGSKTSGEGNENKRHSFEAEDGYRKDEDSCALVVFNKSETDMVEELVSIGTESNLQALNKCTLTLGTQVKVIICNSKALSEKKPEDYATEEDPNAVEQYSISDKELNTPLSLLVHKLSKKKAKEIVTKVKMIAKEQQSVSGKNFNASQTGGKQNTQEPGRMTNQIRKTVHKGLSPIVSKTVGRKKRMNLKIPRKFVLKTGFTQKAPNERLPKRGPVSETEKTTVLGKALKGVTEKSFVVIMRPTCVYKRFYLNIPAEWLHRHKLLRQLEVVLCVGDRTWVTGYHYYNEKGGGLGSGWKKFVVENNLEEFDVCRFTLTSRKDSVIVMDVEIFRAIPDAASLNPT